ncbi:MAG: nucleotidyltransferase family protein [Pyrinomonadaceae bacterium MAG19_C2-C3]|nr:nucleotidyltransferase family protein [Pyrinomonadaceae bacterium MAG19_C2-C3]
MDLKNEIKHGIGIVILAAGASTRLGAPKQLLQYEGKTLLRRAAEAGLASMCRPVVVVLGANAEIMRVEVEDLPVIIVENPAWAEGMSASIRIGVRALEDENPVIDAAVITLCDQPFVTAEIINNLTEVFRREHSPVVASVYGEARGVPALFARSVFDELRALEGGDGARQVIKRHAHEAKFVLFPKGQVDIDTRKDYARLIEDGEDVV